MTDILPEDKQLHRTAELLKEKIGYMRRDIFELCRFNDSDNESEKQQQGAETALLGAVCSAMMAVDGYFSERLNAVRGADHASKTARSEIADMWDEWHKVEDALSALAETANYNRTPPHPPPE